MDRRQGSCGQDIRATVSAARIWPRARRLYIGRCSAYATEFELEVRVLVRAGVDELDPSLNGVYPRPGSGSTYEETLRFGIAFSDGRKATNVGEPGHGPGEPTDPVLWGMGGGGGGQWRQDFWVWPLPPPGPVGFVCEWPAAGLLFRRQEVDAQILLDAAMRARELFPNEPTSERGGTWSSFSIASTRRHAGDAGEQQPDLHFWLVGAWSSTAIRLAG